MFFSSASCSLISTVAAAPFCLSFCNLQGNRLSTLGANIRVTRKASEVLGKPKVRSYAMQDSRLLC